MITMTIPGDARGKGRPRFFNGRAVTDSKTRRSESNIAYRAKEVMVGRPPLSGPVAVDITTVFPPVKSWSRKQRETALGGRALPAKKPDLDNQIKLVLDGVNGVFFADDAQVCRITANKIYGDEAKTIVSVEEIIL